MKNPIVVLEGHIYVGSEIIECGHDNVFVKYDVEIAPSFKIKVGLLVTKTTTREEAITFLDNWTDSINKPTFEVWWPLNNSSCGFAANNFNLGQAQSVEILPDIIRMLELDCLYEATALV